MFSVIIIDDEQTIREGIAKYIKKSFPELTVSGVFSDGTEAIDFLKSNDVDIVITDIKMSLKSGIDVAKYIFENTPTIKTVFLSGYQEFENAKQAIAYNVKYYLSKPVKLSELKDAVSDLLSQIKKERLVSGQIAEERQRFEALLNIVKKDFYTDILSRKLNDKESISLRAGKISLGEDFLSRIQFALVSIKAKNESAWDFNDEELFSDIISLLYETGGIVSAIPILRETCNTYFLLELCGFKNERQLRSNLDSDLSTLLLSALDLLGIEIFYEILHCGMDIFSLSGYSFPYPEVISKGPENSINDSILEDANNLSKMLDNIPSDSQDFADITIAKAKQYIEEHLSEGIGLEDVAGHVYLNPAYFSRFFKQHTEMTMTEYLVNKRMQLAEELIKTHKYKIHEISERCGYRSSKYFTKVFKQYTGYTPSEYIRK